MHNHFREQMNQRLPTDRDILLGMLTVAAVLFKSTQDIPNKYKLVDKEKITTKIIGDMNKK